MLADISSAELTEWQAFYNIEPFGEYRADLRAALVACVMANMWRGKNTTAYKLDDFLLKFDKPKEQTIDEMKTILGSIGGGKKCRQ